MGVLSHFPYCHIFKQPQQIRTLSVANDYVHSVIVYNNDYTHLHVTQLVIAI